VFYAKGIILQEEDYYYSGKVFVSSWDAEAGQMAEMLTIRFDYTKMSSPWTCTCVTSNTLVEVSMAEAERILNLWGLQRLNYVP
jgi:hypothetical protein